MVSQAAPMNSAPEQAATTLEPEEMIGWTTAEIDRAIGRLPAVSPDELVGRGLIPGRIVCAYGVSSLPAAIRRPAVRAVAALGRFVWHGKVFDGDGTGANEWTGGVRFMHFRVEPGGVTTMLDYDRDKNPRLLRGGLDEVRMIGEGVYFAQLRLRTGGGRAVSLIGVTLEPGERR